MGQWVLGTAHGELPPKRVALPDMLAITVALFIAMLAFLELGQRLGHRARAAGQAAQSGVGPVEAAIFGLLGLLLGFAFAGAMSRFENRRQLAIQEVDAIRIAYRRLDLLPAEQDTLRHLFRAYLDARIQVYRRAPDADLDTRIVHAARLQQRIWQRAVSAARADSTENTAQVVLPALNEMMSVTTARTLALRTRLPTLITVLLLGLSLASALIAGYSMSDRSRRSATHMVAYAACIAATVYAVLDLDNPRAGFIHLAKAETLLEDLRRSIR